MTIPVTRDPITTVLLTEPAVKVQTATPAMCGLSGKGSRHSHGLKSAEKPRGPRGWTPPAWRTQAASRPGPYTAVRASPVVVSAPAAPTLAVAAPVVVLASTSVEPVPVVVPAVVPVTPVMALQAPAPAPALKTVSALMAPAALPAPASVLSAPVAAVVAAQPCSMAVAVAVVPPVVVLPAPPRNQLVVWAAQNLGPGWEVAAPVVCRSASSWQHGSRWADISSGWSATEGALDANCQLLAHGVECLSLRQDDSEGDSWMAGTAVPPVDEVKDRRVQEGTEGRSKMEWESTPDPNAPAVMEIDSPSSMSLVLYRPLAAGVPRVDGTMVVPAGRGTYVPPVRAFVSAAAANTMVAHMAATTTAVVPMAAFAAGRVAGENRGRVLFVSALPGASVKGNGGAMLLAFTAPAYVVPQQCRDAAEAVVETCVACPPVLKASGGGACTASASSDFPVAVITAGVRDLVLGDAMPPMVSTLTASVQSGEEAILPALTAGKVTALSARVQDMGGAMLLVLTALAGWTLGDSGAVGPASSDSACVSTGDGKRLPAKAGSTSVVNQNAGGGLSTPLVPAVVVETGAVPGPSQGSTTAVALAVVAAMPEIVSPSRKRKGADLWLPAPNVASLARRGVYIPAVNKRRPFRQQTVTVSSAALPVLLVPVPLPITEPPVILGLTAVFSALTIQSTPALAESSGTVGHLVRPIRTKRSRRRSDGGTGRASARG